jgi:predicted nuclease with TOPRIM domain
MKISEKLKPLLLLKRDKEALHYKNLKNGEKIDFNGKEYVKVKFKFVDTADIGSAKMIHNLETENNLLNEQNKKLNTKLEELNTKVSLLEQLNRNLINSEKQNLARAKQKKIAKQKEKPSVYITEIHHLVNKILKLKELLESERLQSNNLSSIKNIVTVCTDFE